jgi:dUTP pyrophosphatase
MLVNHGRRVFDVRKGMRIAQLMVQARLEVEAIEVDALDESERGQGGFGSTGN